MAKYILAIDQGTSSTKTLVFDEAGREVAKASIPLTSYYEGSCAEQVPGEILQNVLESAGACLGVFRGDPSEIVTCGISNQRETFVVWDSSGAPLYNAILWQCKRSVAICERLASSPGVPELIRERTGLIIDPYFSGTKMLWLYENVPVVRAAVDAGEAFFGTVDTWLLFRLSGGRSYYTDYTNASRTMFFNLGSLTWDADLLKMFGLSRLRLPEVRPSSSDFGVSDFFGLFPSPVPIGAMIGDSHAAAFGEGCYHPGSAKATMGTGCSILMNVGSRVVSSGNGMVSTICWSTADRVQYALEGVIVTCGATIEWVKQELGLFSDSSQTEDMALGVPDNGGVYLVPAFSGLGAPHWDMERKASISGLTFGTTRFHLVRAALESIPYQIKDVISAMEADTGISLRRLMADGGISRNRFIMQFLADLLGKEVVNIGMADVSALGAGYLAGLQAGVFSSIEDFARLRGAGSVYASAAAGDRDRMAAFYEGWKRAVGS